MPLPKMLLFNQISQQHFMAQNSIEWLTRFDTLLQQTAMEGRKQELTLIEKVFHFKTLNR